MTITVEPFRLAHLERLIAQGVQPAQRRAVSLVPATYGSVAPPAGPAITAFEDDRILVCGGILTTTPKLGVLWAVLSADCGGHMLRLHRGVTRFLTITPLRRLEASCEVDFVQGRRWLELLGFRYEGIREAFGADGEDHASYAIIDRSVG